MSKLEHELNSLLNPQKNELKGTLGLSPSVVNVTSRPGYVWVRLLDNPNEMIKAYNNKISPTYDLPVKIIFTGRRYEIEKIDTDRYETWPKDVNYLPHHGKQHSAMRGSEGQDIVWVDRQQFLPILVVPSDATGTNSVNIWDSPYQDSQGLWSMVGGTGVFGFTALDVSGSTLYLLMLSDTTKEFYAITGSVIGASVTGTKEVVALAPAVPANKAKDPPIALIKVAPNRSISWRDIYDLRKFIHPNPSNDSVPTEYVDLTNQVNGITNHFSLPTQTESLVVVKNEYVKAPDYATLDMDGFGFTLPDIPPTGTLLAALCNPFVETVTSNTSWIKVHPDNIPIPQNSDSDEFENGLNFLTNWDWLNQNTCTISFSNSYAGIAIPAETGFNLHGIEKSIIGSNWRFQTKVGFQTKDANFYSVSLYVRDSSTGKILTFAIDGRGFAWRRFNSPTSFDSEGTFTSLGKICNQWLYLELQKYSATSYKFRYSFNGAFYQDLFEYDVSGWLTSPDKLGVCWFNETNFASIGVIDWFRKIA